MSLSACDHRGPIKAVKSSTNATVANGPLSVGIVAPGLVEPWGDEVKVAAKENGWIADILVKEGQQVGAGDILARLDDGAQVAGVALAEADVAEAQTLLDRATRGSTAEELAEARAQWDAASARAERARMDAVRFSRLMEEGLIGRAEGERALREAEQEAATATGLGARHQAAIRGAADRGHQCHAKKIRGRAGKASRREGRARSPAGDLSDRGQGPMEPLSNRRDL